MNFLMQIVNIKKDANLKLTTNEKIKDNQNFKGFEKALIETKKKVMANFLSKRVFEMSSNMKKELTTPAMELKKAIKSLSLSNNEQNEAGQLNKLGGKNAFIKNDTNKVIEENTKALDAEKRIVIENSKILSLKKLEENSKLSDKEFETKISKKDRYFILKEIKSISKKVIVDESKNKLSVKTNLDSSIENIDIKKSSNKKEIKIIPNSKDNKAKTEIVSKTDVVKKLIVNERKLIKDDRLKKEISKVEVAKKVENLIQKDIKDKVIVKDKDLNEIQLEDKFKSKIQFIEDLEQKMKSELGVENGTFLKEKKVENDTQNFYSKKSDEKIYSLENKKIIKDVLKKEKIISKNFVHRVLNIPDNSKKAVVINEKEINLKKGEKLIILIEPSKLLNLESKRSKYEYKKALKDNFHSRKITWNDKMERIPLVLKAALKDFVKGGSEIKSSLEHLNVKDNIKLKISSKKFLILDNKVNADKGFSNDSTIKAVVLQPMIVNMFDAQENFESIRKLDNLMLKKEHSEHLKISLKSIKKNVETLNELIRKMESVSKNNKSEINVRFVVERENKISKLKSEFSDIKPKVSNNIKEFYAKKSYQSLSHIDENIVRPGDIQTGKVDLNQKVKIETQNRNIENIYKKVVEMINFKGEIVKEKAVINLEHPAFGKMEINLEKIKDEVVVKFIFDNSDSKEVIEKGLINLRERLLNVGLEVKEFNLEVKEEQEWYEDENQQSNEEQQQEQRRRQKRWVKQNDELGFDG
ncbi:flagellar hook-length control protein FliK [Thermosipho globiformans]|uniref:flagellar hook-length control protein FliK n=1 Tax=Thermosipho globiformans TaxID=380685 RepID=UPI000F8D53B2|nr:flagellar hook-length control protein FliK [Thermosipho globiformans]